MEKFIHFCISLLLITKFIYLIKCNLILISLDYAQNSFLRIPLAQTFHSFLQPHKFVPCFSHLETIRSRIKLFFFFSFSVGKLKRQTLILSREEKMYACIFSSKIKNGSMKFALKIFIFSTT